MVASSLRLQHQVKVWPSHHTCPVLLLLSILKQSGAAWTRGATAMLLRRGLRGALPKLLLQAGDAEALLVPTLHQTQASVMHLE